MFEKSKLKKEIKKSIERINFLEQKRVRSQAALVEAILKNTQPNDEDVDYFNQFTEKIDAERDNLKRLQNELEELNNK
ncbi:MAG: hypothetical protein K6B54_07785 [Clostridia bacterium]|nr:hypothetical protein [Clostridia bacterium]MCR5056796.1 hypothetical protein [Clostridia bacterium]